jgi:hypothetical protein
MSQPEGGQEQRMRFLCEKLRVDNGFGGTGPREQAERSGP